MGKSHSKVDLYAAIVQTGTESYRLAHTKAQAQQGTVS